ncbi:helicase [Petralouisia muris]|uniref:Helicase n=1 Tax=Petralouisia muris TaxID=3032872 RepID=A0AC61RNU8_9FIRM|nr:helicase [Petralouisia muris]
MSTDTELLRQCALDVGRILRTFKIKKNVEVTDNGKIII